MTALAATLPCAAAEPAAAGQPVVAQGGGSTLGPGDVRALIASLPEGTRIGGLTLPALEQLLRGEIVQRALSGEARAANLERDPANAAQLQRVHDEALTRLYLASKASPPAGYPSDAEVRQAYETLTRSPPAEYHLAQIYVAAPNGAEPAKLAQALHKTSELAAKVNGSDFAQLARTQSEQSESAAKGGDLGFVAESNLLPEVAAAVRALKPGETVGPVKSSQGLHFIKLIERRASSVPPLPEVRERLVAALRARRSEELVRGYLAELNNRLKITFNEIELAKLVK